MTVVVELGNYAYEMLKLEAERRNETMESVCLSFFEDRCNAPSSFCQEVQCTEDEQEAE